MNTMKLIGTLASMAALAAATAACGSAGGDIYGSGDADDEQIVDECLDQCGVGCPAPEYQICASDGQMYCNTCVIDCYGLTVAADGICQ